MHIAAEDAQGTRWEWLTLSCVHTQHTVNTAWVQGIRTRLTLGEQGEEKIRGSMYKREKESMDIMSFSRGLEGIGQID